MSSRTISVLVPAYNEAGNLEAAVTAVLAALPSFDDAEVLIVNDGSTDGTGEVADLLAERHASVRAIHHAENRGVAETYRTGLAQARMEYFTFVPGDGELAPESIESIFAAVGSADLVVPYHGTPGARTRLRRVLTKISTTELNVLFGWKLPYYQGPTVYRTSTARRLPITVNGFFFMTELLVHAVAAGNTWVAVPLRHLERRFGVSKAVSLKNIVRAQIAILNIWWCVRVRNQTVDAAPVLVRSAEEVS